MIYIIILLINLYCIYKYDYRKSLFYKDASFYILLILCILISTFAYRLGTDANRYQYIYENEVLKLSNISWHYLTNFPNWQPGFALLCTLCKSIWDSYYFFKFIYAVIVNTTLFLFFRKNTPYLFSTILIYLVIQYFYFNFEIYRQCISLCIFIWSLPYFYQRTWMKYYLMIILAYFFHTSAALLLLLPLFYLLPIRQVIRFSIVAILALIVFNNQINYLIGQIISITNLFDKSLVFYLNSDIYGQSIFSLSNIFTYIFNIIIPIWGIYWMYQHKMAKKYHFFVLIYAVIVLISQFLPIFSRFNVYFRPFAFVYFIEFFELISS